jgi:hypothetical protein
MSIEHSGMILIDAAAFREKVAQVHFVHSESHMEWAG